MVSDGLLYVWTMVQTTEASNMMSVLEKLQNSKLSTKQLWNVSAISKYRITKTCLFTNSKYHLQNVMYLN